MANDTTMKTGYHDRADEEIRKAFFCIDCNFDTFMIEYYSVRNEVWAESGVGRLDGMLCIGCLERRIGRQLTPEDFPDLPINWSPGICPKSDRLLDRLGKLDT